LIEEATLMMPKHVRLERISLKSHLQLNEDWVEKQIQTDPTILGLGEVNVKEVQRSQAGAGRLDVLLQAPGTNKRFEVELQLGKTDESHIRRTIEYWDIEKKRYPQYEHAAVIIAEEITSRFFNVIGLFNGFIPLIAIQMNAYQVGEDVALAFVTVLDERPLGLVEEDEEIQEPATREYWEKRASRDTLAMTDQVLGVMSAREPGLSFKYTKYYIGLSKDGQRHSFVLFRPRKQWLDLNVKLDRSDAIQQRLDDEGLEGEYETWSGRYKIRLTRGELERHQAFLSEFLQQAEQQFQQL
jgi:hypothetical protein